jgi:hypothetical protein
MQQSVLSPCTTCEDDDQGGSDLQNFGGQEESQSGPVRDWKEKQRDPKWDKS